MANLDRYIKGEETIVRVSVQTSTTVVNIGDLIKLSSGLALRMATSTDNLSFHGVAKRAHASGDAFNEITVGRANGQAVYRFPLNTATTFTVGDKFAMAAGDYTKLSKTDTNPIAKAVNAGASASYADVVFFPLASDVGDAS